jgi:hypothetical protein
MVLARRTGYKDRVHPNNFNSDNGFMLSQARYPLVSVIHKVNKAKQHSDSTGLERTGVRLSNVDRGQELEGDHACAGTERPNRSVTTTADDCTFKVTIDYSDPQRQAR